MALKIEQDGVEYEIAGMATPRDGKDWIFTIHGLCLSQGLGNEKTIIFRVKPVRHKFGSIALEETDETRPIKVGEFGYDPALEQVVVWDYRGRPASLNEYRVLQPVAIEETG